MNRSELNEYIIKNVADNGWGVGGYARPANQMMAPVLDMAIMLDHVERMSVWRKIFHGLNVGSIATVGAEVVNQLGNFELTRTALYAGLKVYTDDDGSLVVRRE